MADLPNWKWEGYAEYIARKGVDRDDLAAGIDRFLATDSAAWAVTLADGTIAPKDYYRYWNLVRYCLDIKKMTYSQLLADPTGEDRVQEELMGWYRQASRIKH